MQRGGPVVLSFARAIRGAGDSITATIANRSDTVLAFNACRQILERRVGSGTWVRVASLPDELPQMHLGDGSVVHNVCVTSLGTLAAGQEAAIVLRVPEGIGAGRYRFRFPGVPAETHQRGTPRPLTSPTFELR